MRIETGGPRFIDCHRFHSSFLDQPAGNRFPGRGARHPSGRRMIASETRFFVLFEGFARHRVEALFLHDFLAFGAELEGHEILHRAFRLAVGVLVQSAGDRVLPALDVFGDQAGSRRGLGVLGHIQHLDARQNLIRFRRTRTPRRRIRWRPCRTSRLRGSGRFRSSASSWPSSSC